MSAEVDKGKFMRDMPRNSRHPVGGGCCGGPEREASCRLCAPGGLSGSSEFYVSTTSFREPNLRRHFSTAGSMAHSPLLPKYPPELNPQKALSFAEQNRN